MKIQKKKKKRQQHSGVPKYIIHKFKIQALPSDAWSSLKILTIKVLR